MREFVVDLHVHTCLSACGMPAMIPPEIVAAAKLKGVDGIGITDHNSAANVEAVTAAAAAAGGGITVFGGMEITTKEEIHLLALFPDGETLCSVQDLVESRLHGRNNPGFFGEQYLVDAEGYVTGTSGLLLAGATGLSIEEAVDAVHQHGGIAVAAHIDRMSFSIVSQLGFIPHTLPLDGVEVSKPAAVGSGGLSEGAIETHGLPVIASSDAHTPQMIGAAASAVCCEELSFDELKAAFGGEGGRCIRPVWRDGREGRNGRPDG